jgi:hypothetical protein
MEKYYYTLSNVRSTATLFFVQCTKSVLVHTILNPDLRQNFCAHVYPTSDSTFSSTVANIIQLNRKWNIIRFFCPLVLIIYIYRPRGNLNYKYGSQFIIHSIVVFSSPVILSHIPNSYLDGGKLINVNISVKYTGICDACLADDH